MNIHAGFSDDGISWNINHEPITFLGDPEIPGCNTAMTRVCQVEGKYYVVWCNGYHGPTIGWAIRMIFKPSTSWKMPSFPITATAFFSLAKSTATT